MKIKLIKVTGALQHDVTFEVGTRKYSCGEKHTLAQETA
jgi:hypothetical protein